MAGSAKRISTSSCHTPTQNHFLGWLVVQDSAWLLIKSEQFWTGLCVLRRYGYYPRYKLVKRYSTFIGLNERNKSLCRDEINLMLFCVHFTKININALGLLHSKQWEPLLSGYLYKHQEYTLSGRDSLKYFFLLYIFQFYVSHLPLCLGLRAYSLPQSNSSALCMFSATPCFSSWMCCWLYLTPLTSILFFLLASLVDPFWQLWQHEHSTSW